jgi:sensor histidine kinase regulating citrate/malate metabolism
VPYQYVETIIKNLSSKQFIKVAEMNKEIENVKGFLEDQNSLLQSLEEGIVVVKKNHIDFINDIFCDII